MIRVIGLGCQASVESFADVLAGATIVARAGDPARDWLNDRHDLLESFDDLFDSLPPTSILTEIVRQLNDLETGEQPVVYLVPGAAIFGDATVAALAAGANDDVSITPGQLEMDVPTSHVQIIDALELAAVEEQRPFDAGLAPLDPAMALLVTNLRGRSVADAALGRVRRANGATVPPPGEDGVLFLDALDPLDGSASFSGLEQIVARLRRPDGCPWDREQTAASLIPMTVEELEELRDAIAAGDVENQAEEMGDVLLHLMLMAQMARESDEFEFGDVVRVVAEKMIRRHPHVFAGLEVSSMDDIMENWNVIKAAEKRGGDPGKLEG